MKGLTLNFSHAHQMFDFDRIDKALDRGDDEEAYNLLLSDLEQMRRLLVHLKFNKFKIKSVDSEGLCFAADSNVVVEDFDLSLGR